MIMRHVLPTTTSPTTAHHRTIQRKGAGKNITKRLHDDSGHLLENDVQEVLRLCITHILDNVLVVEFLQQINFGLHRNDTHDE